MVMKWQTIALSWLIWVASVAAWPDEPKFGIRQVSVHLPNITAYLEVPAENGRPPHLDASDISSVTLEGRTLQSDQITLNHGTNYVLLLDVSGSIRNPKLIRNAVSGWIKTLPGDDHLAIIAVGDGYRQLGNSASTRDELNAEIAKLAFYEQKTKLYTTLTVILASLKHAEETSREGHVVVLVTDGKDEGSDVTATDVQQKILEDHIPIYAIGYTGLTADQQDHYLAELQSFAKLSGGFYDCAGALLHSNLCRQGASPQAAFETMNRAMAGIFVATLPCKDCRNSENHELQIGLKGGAKAQYPVALAAKNTSIHAIPPWAYVAGALLLIAVVAALLLRKKPVPEPEPPPEVVTPVPAAAPASAFKIDFTIVSGNEPGRLYTVNLGEKAVIGRDAGCDLALPRDPEVSARHCELIRSGKGIKIIDLESMNGTLVNGARLIGRANLESGALVRVGRTEFRVRFGEPE
jgi:hypothetical protein